MSLIKLAAGETFHSFREFGESLKNKTVPKIESSNKIKDFVIKNQNKIGLGLGAGLAGAAVLHYGLKNKDKK